MKKEVKSILLLLAFIIMVAIISRALIGGETLADLEEKRSSQSIQTKNTTTEDKNTATSSETLNSEELPTAMMDPDVLESVDNALNQAEEDIISYENSLVAQKKTEPSEEELLSELSLAERITYQEGFYYEPLSEEIKGRITGISYPADSQVPYEDLRYVKVLHYNFDGMITEGELICNKAIAQDMVEIFYELYLAQYQIAKMVLIDNYQADDNLSMEDNNTSAFNYRLVSGTTRLSKHAYGLAIDINPMQNPFVDTNADGSLYSSPAGSEIYADRTQSFDHKIEESDLCYQLFTEHGFIWGGSWNSYQDYQHFQKTLTE